MALDLVKVLGEHKLWLAGNGGCRAYLRGADLRGADLRGANLQRADLQDAYLQRADLRGADLRGADLQRAYLRGADLQRAYLQDADLRGAYLQDADLRGAYLQGADLQCANLQDADLRGAYLQDADLRGAYLQGADLQCANLRGANLQDADLQGADLQDADLQGAKKVSDKARLLTQIVPETGAFEGWKKAGDAIVHLHIPAETQRSNATGRKCRAEYAKVLAIYRNGKLSFMPATSERGGVYCVDKITKCDTWDPNRWNECSGGIHFFITRGEAEAW